MAAISMTTKTAFTNTKTMNSFLDSLPKLIHQSGSNKHTFSALLSIKPKMKSVTSSWKKSRRRFTALSLPSDLSGLVVGNQRFGPIIEQGHGLDFQKRR